jgi:hypothetical protein
MNAFLNLSGLVGWGIVVSIVTFPFTGLILALPVSIVWYVGDVFLKDDRETIRRRMLKTLAISYALYLVFFVYESLGRKGLASLSPKSESLGHPYLAIGGLIIMGLLAFAGMIALVKFYRSTFTKDSFQKPLTGWNTTGLILLSGLLTWLFVVYMLAHLKGCC